MSLEIREIENDEISGSELEALLFKVYVEEGFTDPEIAIKIFSASEIKKRGRIIAALSGQKELLGMVICCNDSNPYRQVASSSEAEMQLLAVATQMRGSGVGEKLCLAFERSARQQGYSSLVLSTQPQMNSAQKLYEKLGYRRNPSRDWIRKERNFWVYEKKI